jgi:transcriptional regulator CtsR
MPSNIWTSMIAKSYLKSATQDEMMNLINTLLPMVIDSLSKPQLKALIKDLFDRHLSTLLRDMDEEERAALLAAVLPAIAREFPLDRVSWESVVKASE